MLSIVYLNHSFFFNLCACVHVKGVFIMILKFFLSSFFLVQYRCKESVLREFLFHSFFCFVCKIMDEGLLYILVCSMEEDVHSPCASKMILIETPQLMQGFSSSLLVVKCVHNQK